MSLKWKFLSSSVTGAVHKRNNEVCQDYSLCSTGENGSLPMLLAVADGHGGKKYVRSAQGAVLACESAIQACCAYSSNIFSEGGASVIKQLTEARLKTEIIKTWRNAVISHAKKNPFSADELSALNMTIGDYEAAITSLEIPDKEKIYTAYGTTLLLTIILNDIIICEQIGDGDILFYYKSGKTIFPVPKDELVIGNETTSLCSMKAPFHMRHSITYIYEDAPDLIMLSTDGYANSFASAEDYLRAPEDFYRFIVDSGHEFVEKNIEKWLSETSEEGSGDDITVVAAWRK